VSSYGLQPIINSPIGQQNYEIIRERIVEILGAELDNQSIINPSIPELDVEVWMERVIPYEENELKPAAVNVLFDNGEFDNNSRVMTDGTYTYFIEIYSKAANTPGRDGDELARARSTRLAGVIRQILMSTQYSALGFAPGVIRNRQVQNILSYRFTSEDIPRDTNHVAVTRITFTVISNESELTSAIVPLGGTDTAVRISCTDKGYVWSREGSYNPDQPYPPCDCEFQVILFNTAEKPLYTLNENTGDTFELPNVTVIDGNGDEFQYPYDPETPIVTTACSTVCADCTVNVNGSLFSTVPSGDTLNVPIQYENGTPVGTINSGVVEIPNPIVCSPSTYQITDSDGNVLYSGSIASGGSALIPISDSVAVLKDTGGDILSSTDILAEGSSDVIAPDGSVSVVNSADTQVDSGIVKSGGSIELTAPDATAVLKDTDGNILLTEAIPSDVSEDIEAPDGTVTVNSAAFDTVLSGGSLNVQVRQETGSTQVGSKQGQFWRIADSDISINGTPFDSVSAEDSIDLYVQYANGTPVGSDVSGVWTIPNVIQDLVTKVSFEAGATLDFDITIDSDTAGTYTGATFGGSTTSATYEVNSVAATLPFTVVATDVLTIFPDADNGFVRLTGTY
jgi:hypothetical protein